MHLADHWSKWVHDVLQSMASSIGAYALNTNEVNAVVRVLRAMCAANDATSATELQRAWQRGNLAVPAANNRMVPVSACVHKGSAPARLLNRCCAPGHAVCLLFVCMVPLLAGCHPHGSTFEPCKVLAHVYPCMTA